MSEHPRLALRRLPPDAVQFQVILGSLLGDGHLVGIAGARRLRIVHRAERAAYALWKYERLGALADAPPRLRGDGRLELRTIAHPLFDDLASMFGDGRDREVPARAHRREVSARARRREALELLTPLGLAVWMADLDRLELRADAFLPAQREEALPAQR